MRGRPRQQWITNAPLMPRDRMGSLPIFHSRPTKKIWKSSTGNTAIPSSLLCFAQSTYSMERIWFGRAILTIVNGTTRLGPRQNRQRSAVRRSGPLVADSGERFRRGASSRVANPGPKDRQRERSVGAAQAIPWTNWLPRILPPGRRPATARGWSRCNGRPTGANRRRSGKESDRIRYSFRSPPPAQETSDGEAPESPALRCRPTRTPPRRQYRRQSTGATRDDRDPQWVRASTRHDR